MNRMFIKFLNVQIKTNILKIFLFMTKSFTTKCHSNKAFELVMLNHKKREIHMTFSLLAINNKTQSLLANSI